MHHWLVFKTARGSAYADPAHIIGLGDPMLNKEKTEVRSLMLTYGYLLVLNTVENIKTLRDAGFSVSADAHDQHAPFPVKKLPKVPAKKAKKGKADAS